MKRKVLFLLLICVFCTLMFQSLTYAATMRLPTSDNDFINTILGEDVTVSNLQLTGEDTQKGIFSGAESILSFDEGIVISTGDVTNIFSPASTSLSKSHATPGDSDLDKLVTGRN